MFLSSRTPVKFFLFFYLGIAARFDRLNEPPTHISVSGDDGSPHTQPIYAAYEKMRQADVGEHTVLLFVECQTIEEFREALGRLPIRHSSEWRHLDSEWRSLNKGV